MGAFGNNQQNGNHVEIIPIESDIEHNEESITSYILQRGFEPIKKSEYIPQIEDNIKTFGISFCKMHFDTNSFGAIFDSTHSNYTLQSNKILFAVTSTQYQISIVFSLFI